MPLGNQGLLFAAVEGDVDEAVLRRLIGEVGGTVRAVYGKRGKDHLRRKIQGFNQAARYSRWAILVDLNREAECAPELRRAWLPDPAPQMCFRIAVRAIEAWLLADGGRIARFLRIPMAQVPRNPEAVEDPKRTLVDLARHSTSRAIREDIVPRPGSGRAVGSRYSARLIQFVDGLWSPTLAERNCESLQRCRQRFSELVRLTGPFVPARESRLSRRPRR